MERKILRITDKSIEFDALMLLLQYWQSFPCHVWVENLPRIPWSQVSEMIQILQGPRIPLISETLTASTYPQMSG